MESSDYELLIIVVNSGVLINERGSASYFTNLLNEQDVVVAIEEKMDSAQSYSHARTLLGDSLGSHLRNAWHGISSYILKIKKIPEGSCAWSAVSG